ncbi:MAG: hypothetical protein K6G10_08840 [Butyrivibrio sp.]|nr:hypothetical protein [Butyrivibrio sp.]
MLDRLIGSYLLEQGRINKGQLLDCYRTQDVNCAKLGVIAVTEKLMTIAQAEQVNMLQATMDKRFGDIAIDKGYLTEAQVTRLLDMQGNSYIAFLQAVVDKGYLSMEELTEVEKEYQQSCGYTETDMSALKTGDIDHIIPIFLGTHDEFYCSLFAMGVKNIYRLVDSHAYIGKAYKVKSVKDEVLGYQRFHGHTNAIVAISGKYEDVRRMAVAYTKEEFIETKEDALDAACEIINCINGLFAMEMSRQEKLIELEPPGFSVTFTEMKCEEILVLPIYAAGGEIKYNVAVAKDVTIS